MGHSLRSLLLAAIVLATVGCSDKVDMTGEKSPQAGAPVPNLGLSKKPSQTPYRVIKGGSGTAVIVK
jgi:hypothetical protein